MSKNKILPNYRKSIIDGIKDSITTGVSDYYVFASNPVAHNGTIPDVLGDDYSNQFVNNWNMIFGKKLKHTDILPIIKKNMWVSKVYDFYDDKNVTVLEKNNFFVISPTVTVGGYFHIYKCLDNNNGAISTIDPGSISTPTQISPFILSDKYKWVYVASVSQADNSRFGTDEYFPVIANSAIVLASSANNSGVEKIVIVNGGSGYRSYANGTIRALARTGTLVRLEDSASTDSNFYKNNAIYLTNDSSINSQIKTIAEHFSNSTGVWCRLDSAVNVIDVVPNVTKYYISPKVYFDTDGRRDPIAYSVVEPVANSISNIVILDSGSEISWANVSIQSNTLYGSGANLYAIVAPPGGHGSNPEAELNTLGMSISFNFSSTESNTIMGSGILYNKIGLIKNPYGMYANNAKSSTKYTANTFSQVLVANVYPDYVFTQNTMVRGVTSGAVARVLFSNTTQVFLLGDRYFINGEPILAPGSTVPVNIEIKSKPSVYSKDLNPLYIQNINNVNRANNQVETFKLIIQV